MLWEFYWHVGKEHEDRDVHGLIDQLEIPLRDVQTAKLQRPLGCSKKLIVQDKVDCVGKDEWEKDGQVNKPKFFSCKDLIRLIAVESAA